MATLKQIEASRINGTKSRGPVTAEGKARTALNSAKHGLYSKAIVLNNEDPEAYAAMLDEYLIDCAPVGSLETRLVTDIVNANWRIDRLTAYETAALDLETDRMRPEIDASFNNIDEPTRATLAFNSLLANNHTYETIQAGLRTQYRIRDRAIAQLLRLQRERKNTPDPSALPAAATQSAEQPAPAAEISTVGNSPRLVNIEKSRSKPGEVQSITAESPTTNPEGRTRGEK